MMQQIWQMDMWVHIYSQLGDRNSQVTVQTEKHTGAACVNLEKEAGEGIIFASQI